MADISPAELLRILKQDKKIKIKVFNLGENLGMDFAYFGHYMSLRSLFPNLEVHLCRSNVDETNCIGLDRHDGKVLLPVDSLSMATVQQRDENERDWVSKINSGDLSIFSPEFLETDSFDVVWCIGMASSPQWTNRIKKPIISSGTVREAVELNLREIGCIDGSTPIEVGCKETEVREWDRTALEYLCHFSKAYPFLWTEESLRSDLAMNYRDYLRVGLRYPDSVRWYYSIERQIDMLFEIIAEIRAANKPVKIVFTLKDGEVGNNFNRGQSHTFLNRLQSVCDDILFTYSWPSKPYHGRPTEAQELKKLREYGITNVRKLDIWEDILLATNCKVYFSDPGGFAEVISMTRKDSNTTFLMPVSFNHASTYLTLNARREVIRTKINPICTRHFYSCVPTLNPPDEIPRRVTHWDLSFQDRKYKIGEDCRGNDWWYFEQAQGTVFKDLFEITSKELTRSIAKQYCE